MRPQRVNSTRRCIDRCAGVPLVWLAGRVRRRRQLPAFQSLGLLQTACIGDTILLAAIVADLRRALPALRIILFTGPSNTEAARLLSHVDDIVELPVSRPWQAMRILRQARVDVLVDCGSWPRINALLAAVSGAKFTIGFRTPRQHRHFAYDLAVDHRFTVHELENYRSLVAVLGVNAHALPHLELPPSPDAAPAHLGLVGPYVVLHPWSHGRRGRAKEWPIRRWLDLARRIHATGRAVAITGSPGDRPRTDRLLGRWLAGTSGVVDLVGRTSLAQLAQVLQRAQCVVSVNTGVVHLAAALDCPVISLDGVTPAWRWGPLGIHACSLGPGLAQYTYLNLGNESPTPGYAHGIRQIACQAVFECLVEKLEQAGTRRDRQRKMEPSAHVGAAAAGMVG